MPKRTPVPQRNGRTVVNALGPVANLEAHVPSDWWRKIFNPLYLKTDGDVVEDMEITRQETSLFLSLLGLQPDDCILDLCCGQGRHTLQLARLGFGNVEGLDRSHYLIQRARERVKAEGLNVRFREGDARRLPQRPDSFDAVLILGNSFGYFDDAEDDRRVLEEVRRVLKPGGRLLIDLADGDYQRGHFEPRSWEWIDSRLFVCRERSLASDGFRLVSREVITDVSRGVIADQFYAERLYSREGIIDLLKRSGFGDVIVPESFQPDSQRNQDLGMMAQRLIVCGNAEKEWAPVRKPRAGITRVAVVMGDPRLNDPVKPNGTFDEDDNQTIERLRGALREVSSVKATYFTKHDTLVDELRRQRDSYDFVFNLCDEGFGNNPHKELHVPAVLEMLGIPYTGAGPQCLAYCYDKSLVRGAALELGISVPPALVVRHDDVSFDVPFAFPAIVKPNFGDSSFGITTASVVENAATLVKAIRAIRRQFGYEHEILVERFLTGADCTIGIIGTPPNDVRVLPIVREDYSVLPEGLPHLCGYEAKWDPSSPYWNLRSVPAELPTDTERLITDWSIALCHRLGCRDYTRLDWRLDADGMPHLLEVNPNPGWCWDGHLAKMAKLAGMSYPEMLDAILRTAQARFERERTVEQPKTAASSLRAVVND